MVRGYVPVPKPADMIYAPIDLALYLAKGLTEKGHEVVFYAPMGSHIPGVEVKTLNIPPLVHNQKEFSELVSSKEKQMHYIPGSWDRKMSNDMFERAKKGEFDILYFHHPEIALASAEMCPEIQVAYTLNDPVYDWYREVFDLFKTPNQHFISISNNQRKDGPDLNYAATVYNGIDVSKYTFSPKHEDYLMIAGRIIPEKGIKEAIQIAKATDHRLFIIGPVYEDQKEYFEQHIKPHLNEKILYLGFMEQEQLIKYYQKAKAFLLPLQWEEPFGLVMAEAMACGTPVIALRRGSAQELIKDGETGFVCDHIQDMIDAVGKIDSLSRQDCRDHVTHHFSIANMVDGYEKVFKDIINNAPPRISDTPTTRQRIRNLPHKIKRHIKNKTKSGIQRQLF